MRLYAHDRHIYEDRGLRFFMEWAAGQWRTVSDDIGDLLLKVHPQKFCDVSMDEHPEEHHCPKATYLTGQYEAPARVVMQPQDRVSRQRRKAQRQTYKRSRRARLDPMARGA